MTRETVIHGFIMEDIELTMADKKTMERGEMLTDTHIYVWCQLEINFYAYGNKVETDVKH